MTTRDTPAPHVHKPEYPSACEGCEHVYAALPRSERARLPWEDATRNTPEADPYPTTDRWHRVHQPQDPACPYIVCKCEPTRDTPEAALAADGPQPDWCPKCGRVTFRDQYDGTRKPRRCDGCGLMVGNCKCEPWVATPASITLDTPEAALDAREKYDMETAPLKAGILKPGEESEAYPPTRDTPVAALDAAMAAVGVHVDLRRGYEPRPIGCGSCKPAIAAILAALPPGWCGHEADAKFQRDMSRSLATFADEKQAEIARLRAALKTTDHGHQALHRRGTIDCPICAEIKFAALAPSEP